MWHPTHLIGSHLQLLEVIHQVFQELGLQVASLALKMTVVIGKRDDFG